MKGLIALFLMLLLALPAAAVDNGQVKYLGGTASGMKTGVIGGIDTTSDTAPLQTPH
ncbi:MAG TPA: hypothetical protein VFE61_05045 [Candidatus Sulfotelmatobacter sp.]|jgi:hypothetical protein|nr:hypothetical protein [Candidatus Sulfotelmatobacter sp.]